MPNATVVTSANPGQLSGKRLAESGVRRIGIVELDDLPSSIYTDISAALPGAGFVDASEFFGRARARADEAECRLLQHASRIAKAALGRLDGLAVENAGSAVGAVEKSARMEGAEEVYVAIASDLDRSRTFLRISGDRTLGARFAVRATIAYKGNWVRQIRTFSRDARDLITIHRADQWFARLLESVRYETPEEAIYRHAAEFGVPAVESWFAEAPVGTRPLSVVASGEDQRPCSAPALVLTVTFGLNAMPWCGAGLVPLQ